MKRILLISLMVADQLWLRGYQLLAAKGQRMWPSTVFTGKLLSNL